MGFELSPRTARKVKALLNKGDDTGTLSTDGRGSARYDTHVKITGPESGGLYPCLPTYYDPATETWVEFEEQRVRAANDEKLVEDRRYRAINYGVDGDYLVFVADEGLNLTDGCYITLVDTTDENGDPVTLVDLDVESLAGCGLTTQEDSTSGSGDDCPKLAVDVPALTGCGLKLQQPEEDSEDQCDKLALDIESLPGNGLAAVTDDDYYDCPYLEVKPGCNITVDSDGVHVDVPSLAGNGLATNTDPETGCGYLDVYTGCGLGIGDEGEVRLDLTDVVYDGLYFDPENCFLGINVECGITYVGTSGIGLDYGVFGDGLEVTDDSDSGCDKIQVKEGCNVTVDGDGVSVDLPSIAGDGLEVETSDPDYDCPYLNVKVGDCLYIDDDGAVAIDTTIVDTYTQEFVGDPYLTGGGCSVGISYPVTTIEYGLNACGLVVSETDLGTVTRSGGSVSIGCCCSSSSSSPNPSSSSGPDCSGWYCCEGEVGYISDCYEYYSVSRVGCTGPYLTEELALAACYGSSSPSYQPSGSSSGQPEQPPCENCGEASVYEINGPGNINLPSCGGSPERCTNCPGPELGLYHRFRVCFGIGTGTAQTMFRFTAPATQRYWLKRCDSAPCGGGSDADMWWLPYTSCGAIDSGLGNNGVPTGANDFGFVNLNCRYIDATQGQTYVFVWSVGGDSSIYEDWYVTDQSSCGNCPEVFMHGWHQSEINAYRAVQSTTVSNTPKTMQRTKVQYPEESYVISLPKRQDRRKEVQEQFAKAGLKYTLIDAIDGTTIQYPETWKAGAGAWGCRLSHMMVLDQAIHKGHNCIAVYEDDVSLCKDFNTKLNDLLREVTALDPEWDAVMIGGQHTEAPVETSNKNIVKCLNCHRTHAYIIRGEYIKKLYDAWANDLQDHIDWVWGDGPLQREYRVYAPRTFLAGQGASKSDITGRIRGYRDWQPRKVQSAKGCTKCRKKGQ